MDEEAGGIAMLLLVIAYLGGVLTIVSPCILPVLPFVFARAEQPFLRAGLPMLVGMAITFAAVASLAAVGGSWAVEANQYGRLVAIVVLAGFGLMLLFPRFSDWLTRPLVSLGERLSLSAARSEGGGGILSSLLLGAATGLLWAPCAGPILGLVLTGAALQGPNTETSLLLLAYAAGAATSLALALVIGGRVFAAMKRSLGASEWIRRGLGAAVLAGVAAIALGLDTGLLTQLSLSGTNTIEQALLDRVQPGQTDATATAEQTAVPGELPVEGDFPPLSGAVEWLNSPPLSPEELEGKVVLVDFWTYSCINCLRAIPYVRAWAERYADQGLVVIGVHTPEFAFEKVTANVERAMRDLGITYPVAIDNDYAIWRAFENRYWPAHYFIDAQGRIRHHHFGEGAYDQSERVIQQLLAEAGQEAMPGDLVSVSADGAQAAADRANIRSPETYIGYGRAENFVTDGVRLPDMPFFYGTQTPLALNQWALTGNWTVGVEHARLNEPDGAITYRFHARDLHLVLGPGADGAPVRFRILIDGQAPGADHGIDTDAEGNGVVTEERLYQLVRQQGPVEERTFEIRFLDPGVEAFAFTFG